MHIKCDRPGCSHQWEYKGKSKFKVTCPMCRKIVTVSGKTAERTESDPYENHSTD